MSRFWAWFAYMPFSLAVTLVFFGHWNAGTVLILLLLSTIPVHLLLNQLEVHLLHQADEPPRTFPKSKILQMLIGMCLGGIFFLLLMESRQNSTVQDKVGNFITGMIAPWLVGSFASQIPLVAIGSLLAGVTCIICITPVRRATAPVAKLALVLLLSMSLFTIWVSSSDLSTTEQVAGFAAETFLKKLIGLPIDLVISITWVVGLIGAFSAINDEQKQSLSHRLSHVDAPPLWVKLIVPTLGWASLVLAMVIGVIRL